MISYNHLLFENNFVIQVQISTYFYIVVIMILYIKHDKHDKCDLNYSFIFMELQ